MIRTKNIIIHSEHDLTYIKFAEIKLYVFDNPYELFNAAKHQPIKTDIISLTDENYHSATVIGLDNYLEIPIKIVTENARINVISFNLSNSTNEHVPVKNNDSLSDSKKNILYVENDILIRSIDSHLANFYYHITWNPRELMPFPSINQHAAETKININRLKQILYRITNIMCDMSIYKNPVINYIGSKHKSHLNHLKILENQTVNNGMYNCLTDDIPMLSHYSYSSKYKYYQDSINFAFKRLPLIALPYTSNIVKMTTSIQHVALGNVIYADKTNVLNVGTYTDVYKNLQLLLKYLKEYKTYSHESLLNSSASINTVSPTLDIDLDIDLDIELITGYLNEKIAIDYVTLLIEQGENEILTGSNNHLLLYYIHNGLKYMIPIYPGIPLPKEVLTQKKLNDLFNKYVNKNNIFDKNIQILDANLTLLNKLQSMHNNHTYNEYLKPTDDIVKHLSNSVNDEMNKYYLTMFYFIKMPLFPTLSFAIADDTQILNQMSNYNIRRLLSKLLISLQGVSLLNNDGNNAQFEVMPTNYKLSLFFYEMLQSNTILNNLEKVCLYESAKGTHAIVNIYYNKHENIHKLVNLSSQYKMISFTSEHITNDDIEEWYGSLVNIKLETNDFAGICDSETGIENCKLLILKIITNYPTLSKKMLFNLTTNNDKLRGNSLFNKIQPISFKLN